jgi:hypothetical protein
MRCPDCMKFVSMENNDPEVEYVAAELDGEDVRVQANVRAIRACADCGTELKDTYLEIEESFPICEFDGFDKLSADDQTRLIRLVEEEHGDIEVAVEENGGDTYESGGSRYKQNLITTTVNVAITLTWYRGKDEEVCLVKHADVEETAAASEYDECC